MQIEYVQKYQNHHQTLYATWENKIKEKHSKGNAILNEIIFFFVHYEQNPLFFNLMPQHSKVRDVTSYRLEVKEDSKRKYF